ncbi:hypothetical protein H8356DRAFT_1618181 [Neocallimastix lanati (nom. inval.)]|nr:hypothetical protein H8356DRAFT_1618181 [Neocallimastix sp. JGI-2020a]
MGLDIQTFKNKSGIVLFAFIIIFNLALFVYSAFTDKNLDTYILILNLLQSITFIVLIQNKNNINI